MGETTEELEHLLHFCRTQAKASPCDNLRLILATKRGDVRLIEVSEDHEFRRVLYEALCAEFIPLGLLGFEESEGEIQARSLLFPWHSEDDRLSGLFDLLCDQAVRNVEKEFDIRRRVI